MKTSYQEVALVLDNYHFDILNNEEAKGKVISGITELWQGSKNTLGLSDKLVSLFHDATDYGLNRKLAKKIIYDILCQAGLSHLLDELFACDILKDKLTVDRKNFVITLTVHDNFIVKSYLNKQKTYINNKFYYDIEEQDLLECYCAFVTDNCVYALYNKRRLLSYLHLADRYLKTFNNINKIEKLKENKNVEMIFTNKELIYTRH